MSIVPYYRKRPADDWQVSITTTERHDNNINSPLWHVHVEANKRQEGCRFENFNRRATLQF